MSTLLYSHYKAQTLWTDKQIRLTLALSAIFWATPYLIGSINEWNSEKASAIPPLKVKIEGAIQFHQTNN